MATKKVANSTWKVAAVMIAIYIAIMLTVRGVSSIYSFAIGLIGGAARKLNPGTDYGTYIVAIVLPFVGLLALNAARRRKHGKDVGFDHTNETSQLVFLWVAFVIGIGLLFGEFWWQNVFSRVAMLCIAAWTVAAWVLPEDKKNPFRYKLGTFIIQLFILVAVWYMAKPYAAPWVTTKWQAWKTTSTTSTTSGGNSTTTKVVGPTHSAIVQKTISDAVFARLPYSEAVALVARAQEESGFRQFNDDGSVIRGKENPKDVCAFQINEDHWGAKAKELGLDIYTLNGCIEMALVIYKERGLDAWNTLKGVENVNKTERVIEAPVGKTLAEAGEIIEVPVGSNCHGIPDKPVIAWDDKGEPHEVTPTSIPAFFTTTVRYSTPDAPAGRITYSCR